MGILVVQAIAAQQEQGIATPAHKTVKEASNSYFYRLKTKDRGS